MIHHKVKVGDTAVLSRVYPVSYTERPGLSMTTEDCSSHVKFCKCETLAPITGAETRLHYRVINVAGHTLWALSHVEYSALSRVI